MSILRGIALPTLLLALGSLAPAGRAPDAFATPARPLQTTRALREARASSLRELYLKRAHAWRRFPHRLGPAAARPFVSGRRAPLLSRAADGRVVRSRAFTGIPDTVRVLGIRIEFDQDSLGALTTTPDGKFDLRDGASLGFFIDPPPHNRSFFMAHLEALSRYWRFASYGNLVVEYDVWPQAENAAYRLHDTGSYGPWTLGQASYDEAQRFFQDAVTAADQTDSIPFGDFDVVTLFHAGSDFQTDIAGDSPRDFPTFTIGLRDSVPVNGGAVAIYGGMVMPESESQDGYYGAINGTLAHEFGHTQGLYDLYDVETFFPGVGIWSNMDSAYLLGTAVQDAKTSAVVDASGVLPASLDPWSKTLLWPSRLDYVDPGRSLVTSLRATELSDRLLYVPLGNEEYYLIENRQTDLNGDNTVYLDRDSTSGVILGPGLSSSDPSDSLGDKEFDFLLPGTGGVLVWHVDNAVIYGRYAPPSQEINTIPGRHGVKVLEADGIEDLGNPDSPYWFGSPFDPYFIGNHTRLGPDTSPASRTNDGGRTGFTMDVKSLPGVEMTLDITDGLRVPGWPVGSGVVQRGTAATWGNLLHDGFRSVVTAADSLIFAWDSFGDPFYSTSPTGEYAALPARLLGPVLFADSLYRRGPTAPHGAAIVATAVDGKVYACRPAGRDSAAAVLLFGWPPALADSMGAPSALATTPPVLDPDGAVLVGGSEGRVWSISPTDSSIVAPNVFPVAPPISIGGQPLLSPVVGTLAVGRFTGAGGYDVAYAVEDGYVRVVEQFGKSPPGSRFDAFWRVRSGGSFAPYLAGADMDRAADGDLELIVSDPAASTIHCYDLAGRELPGWPVSTPSALAGPVALGDLDGDGYPEVFAQDASGRLHRWNRNGIEPTGWPVSLTERYGLYALGGKGSPVIADVDGDGALDVVVALDNGLIVALGADGTPRPGWPIALQGGASSTPLLCSLNDPLFPADPPGGSWTHLVIGGDDDDGVNAFQVGARADAGLFTPDGVSARVVWPQWGGNRQHAAVLEDVSLGPVASAAGLVSPGSFYCYPNPLKGTRSDIGLAYALSAGVTSVEIRVFDPAGAEVERLPGPTLPAQNVARIPVQSLASGVYIVRLEAARAGNRETHFTKFAVVR